MVEGREREEAGPCLRTLNDNVVEEPLLVRLLEHVLFDRVL